MCTDPHSLTNVQLRPSHQHCKQWKGREYSKCSWNQWFKCKNVTWHISKSNMCFWSNTNAQEQYSTFIVQQETRLSLWEAKTTCTDMTPTVAQICFFIRNMLLFFFPNEISAYDCSHLLHHHIHIQHINWRNPSRFRRFNGQLRWLFSTSSEEINNAWLNKYHLN